MTLKRFASLVCAFALTALAADGPPRIQAKVDQAGPREVEETTQRAVSREYSNAWKTLARALAENRPDGVAASFTGTAREVIRKQIDEQKRTGLAVRLSDTKHDLVAVFYSPEGSAMELRDTVTLEKQYLDGAKVVHTEKLTQKYVVLMSVDEDRWKVRLLQELP